MKTKVLIIGVLLSVLIIAGISEVSAQVSIASYNDASCLQADDDFGTGENVYAGGSVFGMGTDCTMGFACVTVWTCPCTVDTNVNIVNLTAAGCSVIKKFGSFATYCEDLGASALGCYDLVIDYDQGGNLLHGGDEADKVDNTGATSCSGCVPTSGVAGISVTSGGPDTIPPNVALESPLNNAVDTDGDVVFNYTVTDASGIASCELIIDGVVNQTNYTITKGITQQFTLTGMTTGIYVWNVNCTDASANEGSGIARTLNVSIPVPIEVNIETKNCTSPGKEDIFSPGGPNVCAYGSISGVAGTCSIWVCPDRDDWANDDDLNAVGCNITDSTGLSGEIQNATVMNALLANAGSYDLVLDCGVSGTYETATDALDDADIAGSSPGFHITPEPVAIVLFAAGLATLYGVARVRRKK